MEFNECNVMFRCGFRHVRLGFSIAVSYYNLHADLYGRYFTPCFGVGYGHGDTGWRNVYGC